MINPVKQTAKRNIMYNSVQSSYKSAHELPNGLVLLDSLKTLETDLQRRKLLSDRGLAQIHPLWFLAETERNIFLWRSGFSLDDAPQFEFWVDIDKLIEKRILQIENYDPENPFFNSLWGFSGGSTESLSSECEYLKTFRELLNSIISHASALSAVTSIICNEISNEEERKIIILPGIKKEKITR